MRGVFALGLPFWKLRSTGDPQLLWSDLHRFIGITSLLSNLIMSTTGFILGTQSLTPIRNPAPHIMKLQPLTKPGIGPDEALRIAMKTWPTAQPTSLLTPSKTSPRYTIYADFRGTFIRPAASFLVIHAGTGEILEQYDARTETPAIYAYNWIEPLHFGAYGGLLLKLIYFVFGLCAAALTITGPMVQILKRRA